LNESSEGLTDRSDQEGSQEEMDDFVEELDGLSETQSGNDKVRVLGHGITAEEVKSKSPGKTNPNNGRKNTSEGGNVGTHTSSTGGEETATVQRPKGSKGGQVRKYREQKSE